MTTLTIQHAVKGQMQRPTSKDIWATRIGIFVAILFVFSQIVPIAEFLLTQVPCRWLWEWQGSGRGDFIAMARFDVLSNPTTNPMSWNIFLVQSFTSRFVLFFGRVLPTYYIACIFLPLHPNRVTAINCKICGFRETEALGFHLKGHMFCGICRIVYL